MGPNSLTVENKNGETAQSFLDKGAHRQAERNQETKREAERLAKAEDEKERKCEEKDKEAEFREKLRSDAEAENEELGMDESRYSKEDEESYEEDETFDSWADRIAA